MKLKFKNQDFQTDAVNAVADLFAGQEKMQGSFTIAADAPGLFEGEFGIGNKLLIDDEDLLENMHTVQRRNRLPLSNDVASRRWPIEMETGTGKTYVYTKTIFELNRRYDFTKFIIVVPSVAIREGVYKSLQITHDHFANHYDNVPCRFFIYNSARLSDVRQFATSANIEIMIINIDAFKKAENIINQAQDRLNGETAMRYIRDTNPVVIVDEPQSVDNTPKAKEAIASLGPLCVLRYSATHREKENLLYRLTPVDAYQMGLVKQICVSSNQAVNDFNKPYIRLVSVSNNKGFSAKIEMDVQDKAGKVSRKTLTVKNDSDLWQLSGERDLYEGYVVSGIDCTAGMESIEFVNTEFVRVGSAIGGVDENIIKRAQIRRTIEAHLTKELMYHNKGIKVLSLFFIDKVSNYREEEGSKGIYARMFEECYAELLATPKFASLKERFNPDIAKAHNGYFSQDKKGHFKDTKGDTQADDDTYNTIMRDKEWLLSFECPLRFIFSHSALKEGWDNPNVFQVCTLIEQKSTFTARQKVGRGLRLCVDQDGNRIEDRDINVLHVMANESFAEFADTLQREIESDTGVKFGYMDISLFSGMVYDEDGEEKTLSYDDAVAVMTHLEEHKLITKEGKIRETMKAQLAAGTLDLDTRFSQAAQKAILRTIEKADLRPPLRDASKEVTVRLNKGAILSPEFTELWNRIKQKTTYHVSVDTERLIADSVKEIGRMEAIQKARIVSQSADIHIERGGVSHTERDYKTIELENQYTALPNIIDILGEQCLVTPLTANRILSESGRLKDFLNNPQLFTEKVTEIINHHRHRLAIDGIRYLKLDGEEYSVMEIFDSEELLANLDRNAVAVGKSLYDYVVYDSSTVERPFAVALDADPNVKLFFKIPPRFKIETPIGTYNPDWAVYLEQDGTTKLYFVLETKGTTDLFGLRPAEKQKILCGKAHFEALGTDVRFPQEPVSDWNTFRITIQ